MSLPLGTLRAFDASARLLSFTRAAEALHLSQSAVSQQIKQLEEALGIVLFRRLTRRLELTQEGARLFETVRRALDDLDRTVADLRDSAEAGSVGLSVGTLFAARWLMPRMGRFHADCPGIELAIRPADRLTDLLGEPEIDIAVHFAQRLRPEFVTKSLGPEAVFVVCSPGLLGGRKPPGALEDLGRFPLLRSEPSEREEGAAARWSNWLAALGAEEKLVVPDGPWMARGDLLVQAAVLGQGAALVWTTMVEAELRDGRLVKLFDGAFEVENCHYAICTEASYAKPKVRAVMDWLTGQHREEGA